MFVFVSFLFIELCMECIGEKVLLLFGLLRRTLARLLLLALLLVLLLLLLLLLLQFGS